VFYTETGRGQYPREVVPRFGLRPTPLLGVLLALLLAGCGGGGAATPSASSSGATQITTAFGRVWGSLPSDFPLLASGQPLRRLDVLSSGSIWSALTVPDAATAAVADLRRLAWEVSNPVAAAEGLQINATRDKGACHLTVIVEPFGSRTALVIYLGDGCPQP